jgi:peptidoglycan L-alanyl-D-glutamate endopeptidase CwlK
MKLSTRCLERLKGVHPDLVDVVHGAAEITEVDFIVTEGLRTRERQEQLMRAGASRTLRSRHLTGHAVDLAAKIGAEVRWDWPLYHKLAAAMKDSAAARGLEIEWGGDWKSFPDGPHFQLPWSTYP